MRSAEWSEVVRRSERRARIALVYARNPERFTALVGSIVRSKMRRQVRRHPDRHQLHRAVLYTAVYGQFAIGQSARKTRAELREAVDAALQRLTTEGVLQLDAHKVRPRLVFQAGPSDVITGCPTDAVGERA